MTAYTKDQFYEFLDAIENRQIAPRVARKLSSLLMLIDTCYRHEFDPKGNWLAIAERYERVMRLWVESTQKTCPCCRPLPEENTDAVGEVGTQVPSTSAQHQTNA